MEKRFLIALLLSVVILLAYPHYLRMLGLSAPQQTTPETTEYTPAKNTAHDTGEEPVDEKTQRAITNLKKEKTFTLANNDLVVQLSNVGASIISVALPQYKEKNDEGEIQLLRTSDHVQSFGLRFNAQDFDTTDYLFSATRISDRSIQFVLSAQGYEITKTFSLNKDGYLLSLDVTVKNQEQNTARNATYECTIDAHIDAESRYDKRFVQFGVMEGDRYRTVYLAKIKSKGALIEGDDHWIVLRRKYFGIFIKPNFTMEHARARIIDDNVMEGIIKTDPRELAAGATMHDTYTIYMGPKGYTQLRKLGLGFEKVATSGFWGLFRMALLMMLYFFYHVFHNYGLAIIALTITIKILFIPLTHKSFSSMKKMQELQPHMKALQEKYKEDPQRLNKEVMQLYKKHKVNPLGGCLPLVLQMPIFIALYQVLSEAVELRGAPFFWWIKDLSQADHCIQFPFTIPLVNINSLNILPLLMVGSMIWQQKLTSGTTAQTKEQQNMMLMMPVVFGFIFYNLPSGLVLYWLVNNILTIVHQLYTHRKHPAAPAV